MMRFLVLLTFLAQPTLSFSDQPIQKDEHKKEIQLSIHKIRSHGFLEAAKVIQQKLNQKSLRLDSKLPDHVYAQTNYPLFGVQKIWINPTLLPNQDNAQYKVPKYGSMNLEEDRVWLASILVHEWYHTTQSRWYAMTHPKQKEASAYRTQKRFLVSIHEQLLKADPTNKSMHSRIEGLIDRVESEIDSYH